MSDKKEYSVGVWSLTYYKIDTETGDELCDDDGKVIEFYIPDEICSYIAERVDIEELVEVKVDEQKPQLVSVQDGIANVCAELGSPLSQEEIDTLLTEKTGGMYDE